MHTKYILGCMLYGVVVIIYTRMINRRLKILKKCENIEDIKIQKDFLYVIVDMDNKFISLDSIYKKVKKDNFKVVSVGDLVGTDNIRIFFDRSDIILPCIKYVRSDFKVEDIDV